MTKEQFKKVIESRFNALLPIEESAFEDIHNAISLVLEELVSKTQQGCYTPQIRELLLLKRVFNPYIDRYEKKELQESQA